MDFLLRNRFSLEALLFLKMHEPDQRKYLIDEVFELSRIYVEAMEHITTSYHVETNAKNQRCE